VIENTSKTHGPLDLPIFGGSTRYAEERREQAAKYEVARLRILAEATK
jgi:hypothetical protein